MTTQPDEQPDLAAIAADALEASWPSAFAVLAHDPADALRPVVDAVLAEAAAQQWIAGQRDEVLRIVAAWCVEANDVGGLDAGDLAWRLEQAGHPLPDTTGDAS